MLSRILSIDTGQSTRWINRPKPGTHRVCGYAPALKRPERRDEVSQNDKIISAPGGSGHLKSELSK